MSDYDDQNIFARILRGEIPCDTFLETERTLVFRDIHPQAPTHLLVIPKGAYVDFDDFALNASTDEIVDFNQTAARATELAGVSPTAGGQGYRVIANIGPDSHQEVPHYHMHILGGRPLGRLVDPK